MFKKKFKKIAVDPSHEIDHQIRTKRLVKRALRENFPRVRERQQRKTLEMISVYSTFVMNVMIIVCMGCPRAVLE
jgi:hypothetical protein